MKTYDFTMDCNMAPMVRLLYGAIKYSDDRLKRTVSGLSQEQIDFTGATGQSNSIGQLLRHLTVVSLHWVYRLQSKSVPVELQKYFGPMYDDNGKLPMVRSVSLDVLLEDYDRVEQMLQGLCTTLTDADLLNVIPFEHGNNATVRWGIWHIADHGRHHYAHIKKLLQEWDATETKTR